jgi:hypothetical protein
MVMMSLYSYFKPLMHSDDSTPVLQPSQEETACDAVHITEDLLSG